ncbi:MAG: 50S ribosomal protein L6 [Planctomycetota bacterium]
MSRVGKQPIPIPSGVTVDIKGRTVKIKGPKGDLSWDHHRVVSVKEEDGSIKVEPASSERLAKALHGTTRQLLSNMVHGVTEGFSRTLDIVGVGYNAKVQGKDLILNIGFCHTVDMPIPAGLDVKCTSNTQIVINGADKQSVGQFAANIRRVRPPEPYKGKGIKYSDEIIRRKAAKSFGAG